MMIGLIAILATVRLQADSRFDAAISQLRAYVAPDLLTRPIAAEIPGAEKFQIVRAREVPKTPMQQVQTSGPPPEMTKIFLRDDVLLAPPNAPRVDATKVAWSADDPAYPRISIDLGTGFGARWYVRAGIDRIKTVRLQLALVGGEDQADVDIRILRRQDDPAIYDAEVDLRDRADAVIPKLEVAAPTSNVAINIIGQIGSPASVAALLRLWSVPRLHPAVEYAFTNQTPVRAAKEIYRAGLRDGVLAIDGSKAAVAFGWHDMLPDVLACFAHAVDVRAAMASISAARTLQGRRVFPQLEREVTDYAGWSDRDVRAIAGFPDTTYAVVVGLAMASQATKGGLGPAARPGREILAALRKHGHGHLVDELTNRYRLARILAYRQR